MKAFGFLSFGHYGSTSGRDAAQMLRDTLQIAQGADEIGINGAYLRVHHFARQGAAPMPLLSAIAATTSRIEVGTGVIDMRYENPLHLAEEAAALDLLADQRVALGVSRGSPEPADRGWEAFGYTGSEDPRGADLGREKFLRFLAAVRGETMADADPQEFGPGVRLRVEPHSPGLTERGWWGAATRQTAEWAGGLGVNLMSSTLVTEVTGQSLGELQYEQIRRYREAFAAAGHGWVPRVSVSRSVFPVVDARDQVWNQLRSDSDQVGTIDGLRSTFGRSYVGSPDELVDQLGRDPAVQAADTLMLTIPNQLGASVNLRVLTTFAERVAPQLGWKPSTEGPVTGYSELPEP